MADTQRLPAPWTEHYDWQVQAACRGMDSSIFFHPRAERNAAREDQIAQAKTICGHCPALDECRDHALTALEPYRIWAVCPKVNAPSCSVWNRCVPGESQ